MATIEIVAGAKENLPDDLYALARKLVESPKIVAAAGKEIRALVVDKASALFLNEREVLALIDPDREQLEAVREQLEAVRKKMNVIIYTTTPRPEIASIVKGKVVTMQGKEGRMRETIRLLMKRAGKKMTEKAFHAFSERIRDEGFLEPELEKLIAYTGSRETIDSKDIEAIIAETHEDTMITLFDAIAARDRKRTVDTLDNLIGQGLALLAIHSFLVRQIRLLLHAKDMDDFSRTGLDFKTFSKAFAGSGRDLEPPPREKKHYLSYQKPGYAFNLLKTSSRFSRKELTGLLERLADFDRHVKKGTRHERVRLETAILGA